jgi:hypothetical protein
MKPIVPPEIVPAQIARGEAHYNDKNGYDATDVGRDLDINPLRIVRSVAKCGLDAQNLCNKVSDSGPNAVSQLTKGFIVGAQLFKAWLQDLG